MTDRDAYAARLDHVTKEWELSFRVEARRLLEVACVYLDARVEVADDEDARVLAAAIRSLLDRRQLLEVEAYELDTEIREAGLIP